jgi:hypothetical protein
MSGNESSSSSRPLNALERNNAFLTGMGLISGEGAAVNNAWGNVSGFRDLTPKEQAILNVGGDYEAPDYLGISGGDYGKLQDLMTQGYTAPLEYQKGLDSQRLDQSLSDRGIWSSGAAVQAQEDLDAAYAPQFANAGAQATNQRYTMEAADLANQNQFKMQNAAQNFASKWKAPEFLQGIYNGTGGNLAVSNSSGWGI